MERSNVHEEYDDQGLLRAKRLMELRYYLHSREAFERLIEGAGFRVERLYGGYEYQDFQEATSPFMIYILKADELLTAYSH